MNRTGTEIKMRSGPGTRCLIGGNHITPGSHVRIESVLPKEEVQSQADQGEELEYDIGKFMRWAQQMPIVGRLVDHAVGLYWDQVRVLVDFTSSKNGSS
jgi:hypothetical protein